jgi:hypothetical protein
VHLLTTRAPQACDTLATMETLDGSLLKTIKDITAQIDVDVVAELQDNLAMLTEEVDTVADIMTQPLDPQPLDEDELEAELNELVATPASYLSIPTAPDTPLVHADRRRDTSDRRGSLGSVVHPNTLLEPT